MLRMVTMVTAAGLTLQAGLALAQPAASTTRLDCVNNIGCSTTEQVYPGTTAYFYGSCDGVTPASQVCTGSHVSTVCQDDPPKGSQAACHCTNPATYENVINATVKVTCRQP